MSSNNSDIYGALLDIDEKSGKPPETRLTDAFHAQNLVNSLVSSDMVRNRKRSCVKGIVDGNAPFDSAKLRLAGTAERTNVNWGTARAFLDSAQGAIYDLFNEAPTYAQVRTNYGGPEMRDEWSATMTEEFDRLQRRDSTWDYHGQMSIYNTVLFGCGPLWFEDPWDWRPKSSATGELYVMERTKSDVNQWQMCVRIALYNPEELYCSIRNPKAARQNGWNIEATRQAIIRAHPEYQEGGKFLSWEYWQQQMKNNSFMYTEQNHKVIKAAHVFYREYPKGSEVEGKISHAIVMAAASAESNPKDFLYRRIGRFKNWQEVVHPMYYDHSGGGYHHSVTGMGVKMYSALEFQNRLLCNLADKAFAPKTFFRPTTPNAKQGFALAQFGEYATMPYGFDMQPGVIQGFLSDGLTFNRELSMTVAANLSQYRQNLQKMDGNPRTATEINLDASEQARLGKTQLNRYYLQLDGIYAEKFRRATNVNLRPFHPGAKAALEFQKRCTDRGVPLRALLEIDSVTATRVAGQGSQFLRQQSLEFLLGMIQMLPEGGRDNLIRDVIASRAGQKFVERYNPRTRTNVRDQDQHALAMLQVVSMKDGVAPIVSPSQDAVIFADTFVRSAAQALGTLQQGGNPVQIAAFCDLALQSAEMHVKRIAQDPTRKQVVQALGGQIQQMAGVLTQVKAKVQAMMQQQQMAQQKHAQAQQRVAQIQSGQDPETQIQVAQAGAKMSIDRAKANQNMQIKADKHQQNLAASRQKMAMADAKTAVDIRLKAAKQQADASQLVSA